MNAASWFYSLPGVHDHAEPKPDTSMGPRVGQTTVVDRWNGTRWIEVTLTWNGSVYVEVAA